ncbi:hypothetical protein [Microbacterium sp. YY-01]|uniref:hypothetical protein n=1 Tax=Microbacterium sp. YY-01 TaxID=3421634 RepID=UPI003D1850B8
MTQRTPRWTRRVVVSAALPAVILRIVAVALTFVAVLIIPMFPVLRTTALIAVVVGVILPQTLLCWAPIVAVVIAVLAQPADAATTAIALVIVHAMHIVASVISVIPVFSRVQWQIFRATLRRFIGVQLVAQALSLGVFSLPWVTGPGWWWLAPVGAAAAIALAVVLTRMVKQSAG